MSAATGEPAVPDPAPAPVAPAPVPPAAPNPPDDQSEAAALRAKLELVKGDALRLGQTNADLKKRLTELERSIREGQSQQLEEQQQYKTLWEQAKQTIADLEKERDDLKTQLTNTQESYQQQQLRAAALGIIHDAGVVAPDQMFALMQSSVQDKDGKVVILVGGVERDLATHLQALKAPGSGFEHHFLPAGARGMRTGANPATTTPNAGGAVVSTDPNNPWTKEGWNRTGQLALIATQPDLAAELKAAAGVA